MNEAEGGPMTAVCPGHEERKVIAVEEEVAEAMMKTVLAEYREGVKRTQTGDQT